MIYGIVADYQNQIRELNKRIEAIQEGCSHPKEALEEKNGGSTGNWDGDFYWTDYHCKLCDKRWTIDRGRG